MDTSTLLWGAAAPANNAATAASAPTSLQATIPTASKTPQPLDEPSGKEADTFEEIGLEPWLVKTLHDLSIRRPTLVQAACIPLVLSGACVCGTACTGSGKTAAYALPILQHLAKDPYGVFATVVAPTREIAAQVADQFRAFGSSFSISVLVLVGGVGNYPQQGELSRRPPIVVGTPGRIRDTLAVHGALACFRKLRYLVLDEADTLLGDSFTEVMDDIFDALKPSRRQVLLFSATMSRAALEASGALQRIKWTDERPFRVVDTGETEERLYTSASSLRETYLFVPATVKLCYLAHLLEGTRQLPWSSCIVFAASCRECEVVRLTLQELGLPVASINSLLTQRQRMESLSLFKLGRAKILVATDVASRGLDIPRVDLVINYDIPKLSKTYVHRAGRTARAGRGGSALCMVTENDVSSFRKIEKHVGKKLEEVVLNEEECTSLLDVVVAARTRAQLSVNQNFGERLREAEDNKKLRDMKKERLEESQNFETLLRRQDTSKGKKNAERGSDEHPVEQRPKKARRKMATKKKKTDK